MSYQKKSKEELINELVRLQEECSALKSTFKSFKENYNQSVIEHRKSEERFTNSIESMNDGFVTLDKNWVYTYVNSNAAKMFDRKPEELVGKHIWTEFPEGIDQPFYKNYYKAVKTQKQINFEEYFSPWNRWFENRVIPSKDGITIYFQDITERKLTELALFDSEIKFRKLVEGLPLPICYVTKEGDMTYRNNRFLEVIGYTTEDVPNLDMWWEKAYPDEKYREWVIQNWNSLVQKASEQAIDIKSDEYSVTCKDGSVRDIIISGITINDDFLATFIDITERNKAVLEIIKAKDRAEESDRLKSAFLANMSHEIRTPMNGILGFADLLKEKDLSGEKKEKYINIIERSGTRMLNIINDLIDISKVESGQMEVLTSETNVNEQVEYIYSFFKPEVEKKNMQLSFKTPLSNNDAIIYSDREKIYAILTNLVKNAIKYSDSGSIELGYELKDKFIQFYVKDSGIGIEPNRIEAIFNRFVQADIEDVRAFQGAGLGLSISKAYVEMLGGKIWVKSQVGKGSIFNFTIPKNFKKRESMELLKNKATKEKDSNNKQLKILIVEDDESSTELLKIALESFCKDFIEVRTGTDAVAICKKNKDIDLILMDIKLPYLNGYEATKQIRQFNKDVIIISQTAFGLYGDREKSIEAGCNDYISKPINKLVLTELIKKYFD